MQVTARATDRSRLGDAEVSLDERPARLRLGKAGQERELFLDWERAIDDGGHLRKCILCGCDTLYRSRSMPRLTVIVVVLALSVVAVGLAGYGTPPTLVAALVVVTAIDVVVWLRSEWRLTCYRCRSTFRGMPLARYHRSWDARTQRRIDGANQPSPGSS
jgi:hypothetical protein